MQIKFHHVNLCTRDVPGLDAFYRDVLDMKTEPGPAGNRLSGAPAGRWTPARSAVRLP